MCEHIVNSAKLAIMIENIVPINSHQSTIYKNFLNYYAVKSEILLEKERGMKYVDANYYIEKYQLSDGNIAVLKNNQLIKELICSMFDETTLWRIK